MITEAPELLTHADVFQDIGIGLLVFWIFGIAQRAFIGHTEEVRKDNDIREKAIKDGKPDPGRWSERK